MFFVIMKSRIIQKFFCKYLDIWAIQILSEPPPAWPFKTWCDYFKDLHALNSKMNKKKVFLDPMSNFAKH